MESELEHILTSSSKEGMVSFLSEHPECIEETIQLAIGDKKPHCWRAVWILRNTISNNNPTVTGHLQKLIDCLPDKEDGHQRELIKLLMMFDLDEDQEGYLFDHCVSFWEKVSKQSSVRFVAILYIAQTVKKYPELKNELALLTEDHYLENISPGIRKSVVKLMHEVR